MQAVYRWLRKADSRVKSQGSQHGICGGQVGTASIFFWVLRFSPTNYHWVSAPYSSFITLFISGCTTNGLSLIQPEALSLGLYPHPDFLYDVKQYRLFW